MQAVDIVIDHAVPRSFRVASLESVFDCPIKDKQRLEWHTEIPDLNDPWSIGLIVGPSGSGKTTIAKHVYGEPLQWEWPKDKALIDALAPKKEMTEVSAALGAVGLNTIPSWARPFHVLSNGEQFRATIARHFLEDERDPIVIDEDEGVRPGTTAESLGGLRAVGGEDATHTAGNAPGVNDGAGALVLASEDWAKANGKEIMGTIVGYGQIGDEYACLAKTPALAAKAALEKIGKTPADVDVWEINEAFASVSLNTVKMLDIDEDKVNVNGGAIALGHPIGASGARVIGALVRELKRRGGGLGCAAICSGGGQGDAILVEV